VVEAQLRGTGGASPADACGQPGDVAAEAGHGEEARRNRLPITRRPGYLGQVRTGVVHVAPAAEHQAVGDSQRRRRVETYVCAASQRFGMRVQQHPMRLGRGDHLERCQSYPAGLVVRALMVIAVPTARLELEAVEVRTRRNLGHQRRGVLADLVLGDAQRPRVVVAVCVAYCDVGKRFAQTGVVREHDPRVDAEPGRAQIGRGRAEGVGAGHPPCGGGVQPPPPPYAGVWWVVHGGVPSDDDAMSRMERRECPGRVIRRGQHDTVQPEAGDAVGRGEIAHDVPRIDIGRGAHQNLGRVPAQDGSIERM
jgi:hypothetical protein